MDLYVGCLSWFDVYFSTFYLRNIMKYYFVTLDGYVIFAASKLDLLNKVAEYRASM